MQSNSFYHYNIYIFKSYLNVQCFNIIYISYYIGNGNLKEQPPDTTKQSEGSHFNFSILQNFS